ncbi:hypothetical protein FSP39_017162 [Pinctada imbricata]|uniref:Protein FAM184A/B N-terminal domain-containing protein n=1 Tax=Pinctada imbricata TaxID=66713 RepID=A0AA88Y6V2_PINIB|nr:hypothetical protein FSP39_017162 [Pinctada imbricata]
MATSAKMSFNYYQNGKYGTLPGNPSGGSDMSQDMHLKMSKKIAQLTKVIYALNTKNDEHESVIQTLKEQHEEQIQQLLSETRDKILTYKKNIDEETDYADRVTKLEATITEFERHKIDALHKFEVYKKQAEDREMRLKKEHSQKYVALSQEVLVAKKNFEEQLSKFELWRSQVDMEKEKALEDLKKAHEKEVDEIRHFHRNQNDDWLNECAKIEDKYKDEVERLRTTCETLTSEKQKYVDEYDNKLQKAQAFYEKELEALRNSKDSSVSGLMQTMQEEKEKMKKDFAAQQAEMKKQVDSLVSQLSLREEEVEKYHKQLRQLQDSAKDKDATSAGLYQQLQEAKVEASDALTKLKELQSELVAVNERCKEQAQDLLAKSNTIGQLEGTNLQKTQKITQLEEEIRKLKDRLSWLESERRTLESQKNSLNSEQNAQLKALERSLEDLSIEKQTMVTRLEKEVQSWRDKHDSREKELMDRNTTEVEQLQRSHKDALERERQRALTEMNQANQNFNRKYEEEIEKLNAEKAKMMSEFERTKSELSTKLSAAEAEVKRLDRIIQEHESGLGSASTTIANLKEASHRLQVELEKARDEVRTHKNNAATLKVDLDKLRSLHENKMKEAKSELKNKLDQLSHDLENKWSETLKTQCAKLKQELTQQKEDEKKAALQQLSRLKDEEIKASKKGWENIVNDLQKQITDLKSNLSMAESNTADEIDKIRREAEQEREELERKISNLSEEYTKKIAIMEQSHNQEIEKTIQQKTLEIQDLEKSLQGRHMEEMQHHLTAHKAALESVKSEAQRAHQSQMEEEKVKHSQDLENLKQDMNNQHASYVEELTYSHESQLESARLELERAVEISKQRDQDHAAQVEELQSEIGQREQHIKNLQEEIRSLQSSIERLMSEIDKKGQEIIKIRNDANLQLRKKEEVLTKRHQHDLDCVKSDFKRESEDMVTEFTEAQNILTDKISELQILLEEAEERYNNRESRTEDLELIEQLRNAIQEREQRMKTLIDEKRYYQLELVNRETNFNKVFNTNQNVGVINPLAKKPKKGERSSAPAKQSSQPNLNSSHRLDPLPHSPLHAENLNPTKPLPLPAFTKKFVK